MIQFKEDVEIIWFMLGGSCNLRCSYCVQSEKTVVDFIEIKEDIYKFINSICENQEKIPVIKFYGGEPLLYWNNIVNFVNRIGCKVKYCLVSNGSLFDNEKVRFCNENNIKVIISWDGKNSKYSRGIDVFDKKFNVLMNIDRLMIHSVFNGYSRIRKVIQDVENLDIEYYAEKGRHIGFGCDIVIPYYDESNPVYKLNYLSIINDIDYYFGKYYRNEVLSKWQ